MTYYEKVISGGPDTLAKVLTDIACNTVIVAYRTWSGQDIDIPESIREDTVEHYHKILASDYKEEN